MALSKTYTTNCTCIVIISILLALSFFPANFVSNYSFDESQDTLVQHRQNLNISTRSSNVMNISLLVSKWESLFKCIILKIIDEADSSECIKNKTIMQILLINTHNILKRNMLNYSKHHMLSLRRQIIIIAINTDYILNNTYNKQIYSEIIKIFILIRKNNAILAQHQSYPWFHIHVSKAAGKATTATFRHIINEFIYDDTDQYMTGIGTSSNIPCFRQYLWYKRKKPLYISRENPIMSYSDDNIFNNNTADIKYRKPSLCKKFIYLLPFREPIERICSQSSQFNSQTVFSDKNIFRTLKSYNNIHKNQLQSGTSHNYKHVYNKNIIFKWWESYCYKQSIKINGVEYRVLSEGMDYRGYFKDLIDSENISHGKDIHSVTMLQRHNKEASTLGGYKLWQFEVPWCFRQKDHVNLFPTRKVNNLNESEFIISLDDSLMSRANVEWFRTKSSSNIYTTWFGYNKINIFSWVSNYVKRTKINFNHFMNSVKFILKIDYVLPFQTSNIKENINLNHKIWNITLNDIFNYYSKIHVTRTRRKNRWRVDNDFMDYYPLSYEKNKLKWISKGAANRYFSHKISSKSICNSISNEERELLLKYNKFDLDLYKIAKLIEKADVTFYEY